MSILKGDKMSPLFQEVMEASSVAQFPKTGYQMKDMDINFLLIPSESVWIYWLGHNKPAKLSTSANIQYTEKLTFFSSAEKLFSAHFTSKCCHSIPAKDFL